MRRANGRSVALVMSTSLALAGCGYHMEGHSDALPKSIHVIAVPAMENKTTTYRIEQKLTAATVHEFLAATKYKVVSDPNGGDAVLRGKVLSLEVVPLTYQQISTPTITAAQATSMLITMKCEVTLFDRDTDKVLYHNDNFVFRDEYELATGLTEASVLSFFQESEPAQDRMAQDFAQRLVAAVTENY
jgi:outer membrane lipopolysaccharide assembly protein LptE/RlpB